jgi:hypothetical protein
LQHYHSSPSSGKLQKLLCKYLIHQPLEGARFAYMINLLYKSDNFTVKSRYSIHPKAGPSEFRMVISRTLLKSGFRSSFSSFLPPFCFSRPKAAPKFFFFG